MCIDKPDKFEHVKSPKAPKPNHINKPKKEKQINELLNAPQKKPTKYKITKAPPRDTSTTTTATATTTKRIVESITVCF
jgi:hypothetical protein